MPSLGEAAGGSSRKPSLRAIRSAHQQEVREAESDFAIRTKEDVALFLGKHIVPYVAEIERLTGALPPKIYKYMTVYLPDDCERYIEVSIETPEEEGELPTLDIDVGDAEPMTDEEIAAEWDAIVASELLDVIDYESDDDEGDTLSPEPGIRLLNELDMPILRLTNQQFSLEAGREPNVSLELGYVTDEKRFTSFEQELGRGTGKTLTGSTLAELQLFELYSAQLSQDIDPTEYRKIMQALGVIGIIKAGS